MIVSHSRVRSEINHSRKMRSTILLMRESRRALFDFWKYDPVSKNWTPVYDFIDMPRFSAAYGSNGSVAYYGFGYIGSNVLSDLYLYYPVIE